MEAVFNQQQGEISQFAAGKNPFGSYRQLIGVREVDQEIEAIGGSEQCASVDSSSGGGNSFWFKQHELALYVDVDKTWLAEKQSDGTFTELHSFPGETQDPSIAVAEEAGFFCMGKKVHKIKEDANGDVEVQPDLLGATEVTAIAFGNNRIVACSGTQKLISNMSVQGDGITTFSYGIGWLDGGKFFTSSSEPFTNVKFVGERFMFFTPRMIEVNEIKEKQDDDGTGVLISVKDLINYGTLEGIGTSTFRQLGVWGEYVLIVDEKSKTLYMVAPQRDQNNKLIYTEVKADKRNLAKFEFDKYLTYYSNITKTFLIACRTNGAATNDWVFIFDPETGSFAQKRWSARHFSRNADGDLIFNSASEKIVLKYTPDKMTDHDESLPTLVIETNELTSEQFWRKFKTKILAIWMSLNPDAQVKLYQSIDGGDWAPVNIKIRAMALGGSYDSPFSTYGVTTAGLPKRETADDVVEHVLGKIRVRGKGTKIAFRLEVVTDKKFWLKAWGIPKMKVSSRRKHATLRKT